MHYYFHTFILVESLNLILATIYNILCPIRKQISLHTHHQKHSHPAVYSTIPGLKMNDLHKHCCNNMYLQQISYNHFQSTVHGLGGATAAGCLALISALFFDSWIIFCFLLCFRTNLRFLRNFLSVPFIDICLYTFGLWIPFLWSFLFWLWFVWFLDLAISEILYILCI